MDITTIIRTEKESKIRLDRDAILTLLEDAGIIECLDGSRVEFTVPTGGDCSGMTLSISNYDPIIVTTTEITTEET